MLSTLSKRQCVFPLLKPRMSRRNPFRYTAWGMQCNGMVYAWAYLDRFN